MKYSCEFGDMKPTNISQESNAAVGESDVC